MLWMDPDKHHLINVGEEDDQNLLEGTNDNLQVNFCCLVYLGKVSFQLFQVVSTLFSECTQ